LTGGEISYKSYANRNITEHVFMINGCSRGRIVSSVIGYNKTRCEDFSQSFLANGQCQTLTYHQNYTRFYRYRNHRCLRDVWNCTQPITEQCNIDETFISMTYTCVTGKIDLQRLLLHVNV